MFFFHFIFSFFSFHIFTCISDCFSLFFPFSQVLETENSTCLVIVLFFVWYVYVMRIMIEKKYCLKWTKALTGIPFFHCECVNLTISRQQLEILIKYRKFLRRAIAYISTCKGDFQNVYFLLIWQFHNNNCSYSLSIVNILEEQL